MSYSSLNPLRYCFGIGEPYTSKIASKIQIWMDIEKISSSRTPGSRKSAICDDHRSNQSNIRRSHGKILPSLIQITIFIAATFKTFCCYWARTHNANGRIPTQRNIPVVTTNSEIICRDGPYEQQNYSQGRSLRIAKLFVGTVPTNNFFRLKKTNP